MRYPLQFLLALCWLVSASLTSADDFSSVVIESSMVHLRASQDREWDSFPNTPGETRLERGFESAANAETWTLSLRQQNVKQNWEVRINGSSLGKLVQDENDLQSDFDVPAGTVVQGDNRLEIRQATRGEIDDVSVGQVALHPIARADLRNMATVNISITDESGAPVPGRITVVDEAGTLVPVGANSATSLAVRAGVIYTTTGQATFGVAAGAYRVYASRGLEYSVDEATFSVTSGENKSKAMKLERELETTGWIACDTHVHTLTHSGHGDCTIDERMATLAGEGIELPIATDHNKHIDYRPTAQTAGVSGYFTPVVGNEVTTKQCHINIFPIQAGSTPPDAMQQDWDQLFDNIFATPDVQVAILNHARDVHSGFRPFSPARHVSLTGENLDGRPLRFNAMEVINSGAVQTDAMQLFFDWCGLINRGLNITPVGSSDSHDVARFIVGQGRTYIRCNDSQVGSINVAEAVDSFVKGRVVVSYGLLAQLRANDTHQPGDFFTLEGDDLVLTAEVQWPTWGQADSIVLYLCGQECFRQSIPANLSQDSVTKATATWRIARSELKHDVWVSAVARGPGIEAPFWATALPYQPTSTAFTPYVFSSTGPIRIDVGGDGKFTSPFEYAQQLVENCEGDMELLAHKLKDSLPCVTHQAASILRVRGDELTKLLEKATGQVATGIADYQRAWQQSVVAQLERAE